MFVFFNNNRIEVDIKEEVFEEETPPTIKNEPPDVADDNVNDDTKPFLCEKCGENLPQDTNFCVSCYQDCVLEKLTHTPHLLTLSGLKTFEAFVELLKYMEDDLLEIEGCHKSSQLLSVLIKLHSNRDFCFVSKYRMPLVYVRTVEVLSAKLAFLGDAAWKNDPTPTVLQPLVGETNKKIVIFHVISLKVHLSGTVPIKDYKSILVGYTASGRPFYFSPLYPRHKTLTSMIPASDVLTTLNCDKNVFVVYKLNGEFVKGTPENFARSWQRLVDDEVHNYLEEVTMGLERSFAVLGDVHGDYALGESDGGVFLRSIVGACVGLFNYKLYLKQL